jgi:catechol 2,3-dioxygenase-like lactoylglutathione lyase family enzyme
MQGLAVQVSHIIYPVRDMDATIDWYTSLLGFKLLRRYSSAPGRESAYLELDGVLLELMQNPNAATPSAEGRLENRIGVKVLDLDAALVELKSKGVEMNIEPYDARTFWGRQASIKDPNGYGVSLREWLAPDSPTFPDWQPRHEGTVRTG